MGQYGYTPAAREDGDYRPAPEYGLGGYGVTASAPVHYGAIAVWLSYR